MKPSDRASRVGLNAAGIGWLRLHFVGLFGNGLGNLSRFDSGFGSAAIQIDLVCWASR